MKEINVAKSLFLIAFVFWVCYQAYFGWNKEPINDVEKTCDLLHSICISIGAICYLLPMLKLYENIIKSKGL